MTIAPIHHDQDESRADAAFERECARSWPSIVRYLRAITAAGTDVENLAGRTIEIAWQRRGAQSDALSITPWLLGIATNVARNAARGSQRFERMRLRLRATLDRHSAPTPHAELMRTERGPATRALATLSADDRQILVLHAWEELTNEEIAVVLSISTPAAAQRLHRARKRLAAALESIAPEEPLP